ncbi:MAG TPA: hypothetical protein VNC41_13910 [Acidimicrobiia bacterium]|nr:hypothetical protein [Acidimicrobiia bacterium]
MIRLTQRAWLCTHCGALVESTTNQLPTMITHVAPSKPRVRQFFVDRDQIHACTIQDRA